MDNKYEKDSKCGTNIGNVLECARGNNQYNMCQNAHISDGLVGAFQSNRYELKGGDTCMIPIKNAMSGRLSNFAFWKIWKD